MIAGFAKEFGMTLNEVLYDMSYANLSLYSASLPHYDDEEWDESIDACSDENIKRNKQDDDEYIL